MILYLNLIILCHIINFSIHLLFRRGSNHNITSTVKLTSIIFKNKLFLYLISRLFINLPIIFPSSLHSTPNFTNHFWHSISLIIFSQHLFLNGRVKLQLQVYKNK